jgi:hypothetical protein
MSVATTCPQWCESSPSDGQDQPLSRGTDLGGTPRVQDIDLDARVAAGSIEAGALRVYLNVRKNTNLTPAHSRELALKLLEAAFWVENHSVD